MKKIALLFQVCSLFLSVEMAVGKCIDLETVCELSSNVGLVPGRQDYALDFRRMRKPIHFRNHSGFGLSQAGWSLSFACMLTDSYANSAVMSSKAWENFLLWIRNGKELILTFHDASGKRGSYTVAYDFIPGSWVQCFITQQANGDLSFYVNGVLQKCFPKRPLPSNYASVHALGAYSINGKGNFDMCFRGLLDALALYDTCLDSKFIHKEWQAFTCTLPLNPMPQQVVCYERKSVFETSLNVTVKTPLLNKKHWGWELLQQTVSKRGMAMAADGRQFVICDLSGSKECPAGVQRYLRKECFPSEGYVLSVKQDGIWLIGKSSVGIHYGLQTVCQLLERQIAFSGVIFDYPDSTFRSAMYVNDVEPPIAFTEHLKSNIDAFAKARVRYFMLRTHDWFLTDRDDVRRSLQAVIDYCASREMIVLPYMQNYGHAKGILYFNPRFGHTKTIKDERHSVPESGEVTLAVGCVHNDKELPIVVMTEAGARLKEGADYRVSIEDWSPSWMPPKGREFRFPWARPYVDSESGKCKITFDKKYVRQTITVTYDVHGHTECVCPFSGEFQKYIRRMIANALTLTGADYVNLGLDEIWSIRGTGRCCSASVRTQEETMGYAFNFLYDAVQSIKPGVKVMAFGDMLDPNETPHWKSCDVGPDFARHFNSNIIMMPWMYDDSWMTDHAIGKSIDYFSRNGFQVIGVAGLLPFNQVLWKSHLQALQVSGKSDGFFYTMWDADHQDAGGWAGLDMYSQLSWSPCHLEISAMNRLRMLLEGEGVHMAIDEKEAERFLQSYSKESHFIGNLLKCYADATQEYRCLNDGSLGIILKRKEKERLEIAMRNGRILIRHCWNLR